MLKGLGNLANLGGMMSKLQSVQAELQSKRVTGSAGGGLVEVEASGSGEVLSVRISPTLLEKEGGPDREMIEDLLPAAINDAVQKTKQLYAEAMQEVTGGMNLPGMGDLMAKFTGGGD